MDISRFENSGLLSESASGPALDPTTTWSCEVASKEAALVAAPWWKKALG